MSTYLFTNVIHKGSSFIVSCLFIFQGFFAQSQKHNVINFSTADGLPSLIVNDIFQDREGYFWLATQDGISVFNGHEFSDFHPIKALEGVDAVSIVQDKNGRICIGTNTSGLFIYDYKKVLNFSEKKGLKTNVIRRLFIDHDNNLWVLTAAGIYTIHDDKPTLFKDPKGLFESGVLSMTQTKNGDLWFGTQGNGLVRLSKGEFHYFDETSGLDDRYVFSLSSHGDSVLIGTTNKGAYIGIGNKLSKIEIPEISNAWISTILNDWRGMFIVSSSGLVHIKKNGDYELITEKNGLSSNDLYNGYFDREFNLWLTSGNGVSCLKKEDILLLDKESGLSDEKITALCSLGNGVVAAGTYGSGINVIDASGKVLSNALPPELENVKITTLCYVKDKKELWVGSELSGHSIFIFNYDARKLTLKRKIKKINNSLLQTVTKIETDKRGNIWVGTFKAGLFKISSTDTVQYNTRHLLPSNEIFTFVLNSNDYPLVSIYQKGLYEFNGKEFVRIYDAEHFTDRFILSVVEGEDKTLYIGTKTNGLVILKNGVYSKFTTKNGLLSNTVQAVVFLNNQLWVGTNRGVNILRMKNGNVSSISSLEKRSGHKSTEIQQNALISTGKLIWVGSTTGLLRINPVVKFDQVPKPIVALKGVKLFFEDVDWSKQPDCTTDKHGNPSFIELGYKDNHLTFHFCALTTSTVYYSYFLEGQDKDWTPLSEKHEITFSNLTPGSYTFKLRAVDNYGRLSDVLSVPIVIRSPYWNTWWFRVSVVLLLIAITYLIIRMREKNYKERQVVLEETVKERTTEVVQAYDKVEQQKQLVELKNKEILDSISYAKRIQSAMLPSDEVLKNDWNEIFVLYKPKDIVAGDFYWSERINEKQLIAVADCTGHGVPGAMISLVCNNALNRSIREYGVYSPSKLLDKTRELILEEFSKYQEDVNDGMDITLLLFDKSKMTISWAGANLPLWIIKNGEQEIIEIKGDKQPVGKHLRNNQYTEHEVSVSTGDQIYMTTDGYFDQFGGERGKKLKSAELKKMIEKIASKSSDEQKRYLEKAFDDWKGEHEQVDDVCVVGIRF